MSEHASVSWACAQQPRERWFKERNETQLRCLPTLEQKLVLVVLATYCDDRGECFPSIERLARDCSMGERTLKRVLRALVEDGYIVRRRCARTSTLTRLQLSTAPN